MSSKAFSFLRPYLCRDLRPVSDAAYLSHLRFHSVTRRCNHTGRSIPASPSTIVYQRSVEPLREARAALYPRIGHDERSLAVDTFCKRYAVLESGEYSKDTPITVRGRSSCRAFPFWAFIHRFRKGTIVTLSWSEAFIRRSGP